MKNIAQICPVESYEWRSPGSTQYKGLHGEASSAWKDCLLRLQVHVYENVGISGGGGGGDGTPYDCLIGEAAPEKGIFSMLQVYERVVVSLVEVCKRVGKSVIAVCEKGQKGLTDLF